MIEYKKLYKELKVPKEEVHVHKTTTDLTGKEPSNKLGEELVN